MISIKIVYFNGQETVSGGRTLKEVLDDVQMWHRKYPDKAPSLEDIKSITCNNGK